VKDPIRSHEHAVGEASVQERTGRTRQEWFAMLDAAGASAWTHKDIAAWLVEQHDVEGWWAQSITVGYEQARGIRAPGQRSDGTWEAGASVTVRVGLHDAFAWVSEPERRVRWLDHEPAEVRGETPGKSIRWVWDDGSRVGIRFTVLPDDAEGPRTRVTVAHRGLDDGDAVAAAKEWWQERLATLREVTAEPAGDEATDVATDPA